MLRFLLRRLLQSVITIFSVMVITFLLFRVVSGDIAAAHKGQKASLSDLEDWRQAHGYNLPWFINVHNRLALRDHTTGPGALKLTDMELPGWIAAGMGIEPAPENDSMRWTRPVAGLSSETPLERLTGQSPSRAPEPPFRNNYLRVSLQSGPLYMVDLTDARTVGDLIERVTTHPEVPREDGKPLLRAEFIKAQKTVPPIETTDAPATPTDEDAAPVRLAFVDETTGPGYFNLADEPLRGNLVDRLTLIPTPEAEDVRFGRYVFGLDMQTPFEEVLAPDRDKMAEGQRAVKERLEKPDIALAIVRPSNGQSFVVDLANVSSVEKLRERIESHPENRRPGTDAPAVTVGVEKWGWSDIFESQFAMHLYNSVTFQARSLTQNKTISEIIAERAPASLALTIPALAISWLLAMIISSVVAYFRGTWLDNLGVFLSVLGMCVPFLAWMIYGQALAFKIAPARAYGTYPVSNIYVPITILVVSGLGASIRFYRTVILDETNRDYVRTARAKGVPLPTIMFQHVLKNCMLPILTNLILAIPFLIMGNLLLEKYFGIPGLGDLTLQSITTRDEPIMSAVVFLSAVIYTLGVLVTDICYGIFDPRVRLQ